MMRAAMAAVAVATVLAGAKLVTYILTDSIAMLASFADSALDIFASFVNLLAIRHALTPADREHRFGHGKAEPLAGLGQGGLIAGSAAFLIIESASRLLQPHPVEDAFTGVVVMVIAIVATGALVIYQRMVVARTGSVAVGADRMHYLGDLLINGGVIVGIVLSSQFGLLEADPLISIAISCVLLWSAWHVFMQSYHQLMDHELPDADREKIKAIVRGHADVRNLHDLRTRAAGTQSFIQLHLELDPRITLARAHEISDAVEHELLHAFPNAEVIIHQDPAGIEAPPEPLAAT
ncbi:MAG: cation diffusion facilitator family transporter [Proteobacteria bacterium]|nr:cation diffusion facilitator family transporter [Pseudomonadota bacterium]